MTQKVAILCSDKTKKTGVVLQDRLPGVYLFNEKYHVPNWNKYNYIIWGAGMWEIPRWASLNSNIRNASNKVKTFMLLHDEEIPTLDYYQDLSKSLVNGLLLEGEEPLVARKYVSSSKGKGIKIIRTIEDYIKAPLYTILYDKTHEFRVFVGCSADDTQVLDYVQKKRKNGSTYVGDVWNKENGFVFSHNKIIVRDKIKNLAKDAVTALGLDFGAVDILAKMKLNPETKKFEFIRDPIVCEVNSAPGLINTKTLDAFVDYFKGYKTYCENG